MGMAVKKMNQLRPQLLAMEKSKSHYKNVLDKSGSELPHNSRVPAKYTYYKDGVAQLSKEFWGLKKKINTFK